MTKYPWIINVFAGIVCLSLAVLIAALHGNIVGIAINSGLAMLNFFLAVRMWKRLAR